MTDPNALLHEVNDPLSTVAGGAGEWGLPSQPDTVSPAHVPPELFDYSKGIFAGLNDTKADAVPGTLHPDVLALVTDYNLRGTYETPHESTHRRVEPPFTVPINQAAAGFTLIAPTTMGMHYIKLLGCFITLDAAGTLRFVQGSNDGTNVAPMTGNMNLGGAAVPALFLPMVKPDNPHHFTSPAQALGIFTATGKAQGWAVYCNAPYDS